MKHILKFRFIPWAIVALFSFNIWTTQVFASQNDDEFEARDLSSEEIRDFYRAAYFDFRKTDQFFIDKSLCRNAQAVFEYRPIGEIITKVQICKNVITFYADETIHVWNSLFQNSSIKDDYTPVSRDDVDHCGKHRSISEIGELHFHIKHTKTKRISVQHLKIVLVGLKREGFLSADIASDLLEHYRVFLAERPSHGLAFE